jgi:hypothetical protein
VPGDLLGNGNGHAGGVLLRGGMNYIHVFYNLWRFFVLFFA